MNRRINKITICLIIFMLLFLFSVKCFATTDIDYSYYNDILKNAGNKPYFLSKNGSTGYFALFVYPCTNHYNHWDYEKDDIYFYNRNNVLVCRNATRNEETTHFSDYACDDGKNVKTVHSCWNGNSSFAINDMNNSHEMYTNKPVYKDIDRKEIFFLRPQTTLAQALKKVEVTKMYQTMMIGLVKYLVLFLIGLVAFWKSWQFLFKNLQRA